MKLTDEVYLVAGGDLTICMTHPSDSAVYLIDGGDGHLALIDAGVGADTPAILRNIESDGLDPRHIELLFLTHAHTDHIGGALDLRRAVGCKVAISQAEAPIVESADEDRVGLRVAKSAGYYPPDFVVKPCPVDIRLRDGQEFVIGEVRLRAIVTPGHSRAGVCYYLQGRERRYLFPGDHISYGGLVSFQNYPDSGSSIEGYRESGEKLAALTIDAFLPGHTLFCLNRGQRQLDMHVAACRNLMFNGRYYFPAGIF